MTLGYARVSTTEQSLDLQVDALKRAGCEQIYSDSASGAKHDRPGLSQALDYLRSGDRLVGWRLDRLGRSLQHLIETVTELDKRGVAFSSITESIDTATSGGRLVFHIFGALAEFERALIRERTFAGLQAARARGRKGGRPKSAVLSDPKRLAMVLNLYKDKRNSIKDICRTVGVTRSTLYRYLRAASKTQKQESQPAGAGSLLQ